MHFVIVEDLSSDRDHLLTLIKNYCSAHREDVTFSCYENAETFLADYRKGFCSAIFLDILLGELSGISAARQVREQDGEIPIVFITAETGFSLDSYQVHALDFLVKPVREAQLSWCMDRISKSQAAPLFLNVRESRNEEASLSRKIPLEELVYVESIRNGLILHTTAGDIRTVQSFTFTEVTHLLPPTGQFCVFSRGQLVNLAHVVRVGKKGEIQMQNGQTLYCSRRKIQEIQEAYAGYRIRCFRKGGMHP